MHASSVLTAAFAGFATAQLFHKPAAQPAVAHREALDAKCTKALNDVMPVYKLVPTPPPSLATAALPTNPCETPAFNGTLAAQYSSYTNQVSSWYQSHSSEILGALSRCPALLDLASDVPFCSTTSTTSSSVLSTSTPLPTTLVTPTAVPPPAKTKPATTGGDEGGSDNAFNASSEPPADDKPSTSGAHHTSGVIGMAIAAAGFLGAVVAL